MTQEPTNPATGHTGPESHKFDLQAAYEVMIRSYLRRYRLRKTMIHPTGNEVDHGK